MALQIVLVEAQIDAAVAVKQALEQQRLYQVFPFAEAEAALDFARKNPVDYVVVDMQLPGYPPAQLIKALHDIQPDAILIASTSDSTAAGKAIAAGAMGLIDAKYNARKVLDVLDKLASDRAATQPKQQKPPPKKKPQQQAGSVFDRLAAEEPPMPGLFQGGTITTYMARVSDDELNNLLDAINAVMELPEVPDNGDETEADTPAQFIIEGMLDETLPLENKSFEEYLNRLRETGDTRRYTREPPFLEDVEDAPPEKPKPDAKPPASTLDATRPASSTQPDAPPKREKPAPPPTLPPENDPSFLQNSSARINVWDWGDDEPEPADDPADAHIAQMAVSLTQASLESTAQATLLTEGETVVAYEGALSETDITELVAVITDHETEIKTGQARVRFITLNSSGLDYLVFSRRTENDYLLSMVFEGQTSMTEIRQQSKRILHALNSVPDIEEAPPTIAEEAPSRGGLRLEADPADEVDVGPRTRYTFLWLPRDPQLALEYATTEAINAGLRVQLVERGWQVDLLEVQEDYVYIVGSVPGDEPPQSLVRNLQQRAGRIAVAQNPGLNPDTLWAESYFVLSPGRELNVQEIQQYINFYRI